MTDTQPVVADHPAKWSAKVLVALHDAIRDETGRVGRPLLVLDPFAGVGRARLAQVLNNLAAGVDGVELQPEWVANEPGLRLKPGSGFTLLGDATRLPSTWDGLYDAVCTSPCYGNRMADHHDAKDPCKACRGMRGQEAVAGHCYDIDGDLWHLPGTCTAPECGYVCGYPERPGRCCLPCPTCKGTGLSWRNTYAHALRRAGGDIVPGSAAAMQWGRAYRMLHRDALAEMIRVVVPGGLLAINMANHIRDDVEQDVIGWWVNQVIVAGCILRAVLPIDTPKNRNGANRDVRTEGEVLILAHTPTPRRLL